MANLMEHEIEINGRVIRFRHPTNDEQLALLNTFGLTTGTGERVRICMEWIASTDGFANPPEPTQAFAFVTQLIERLLGGSEGN